MGKQYKNVSSYTPSYSYTYPGILKTELFQKPKIETPALSEFAQIYPGIRSGEYLNLVTPLTRVLQKGTGVCTPTFSGSGSITDRRIVTGLFEIAQQWCKKEFQATANILGDSDLVGDGLSGYELGGKLRSVWMDEILEQARQDLWKVLLFGNDSLGSGSTNLFSTIDGVWTKFFDGFGSYCIKPILNSLPNGHTSVLNADDAINTLRQVYERSPILLKQIPASQKVFWVTGSVWDNLYASYESKQYGTELQFKYLVDGVAQLTYRGTPVRPLWIADYTLENDTDNPYYDILRHFIIYTVPNNHIIGVENTSDLNNVEMWYDRQDRVTKAEGEMRMGYNFLHCDLTSIAF